MDLAIDCFLYFIFLLYFYLYFGEDMQKRGFFVYEVIFLWFDTFLKKVFRIYRFNSKK